MQAKLAIVVTKGKNRQPGDREPNGRLRRNRGDVRALNIYNRGSRHHDWVKSIVDGEKREAVGLAWGEIGRWEGAGLVTESQAGIARHFAIHVGEYEAAEGLPRRSARSPGFEVGHRGMQSLGESSGEQRRLARLREKHDEVLRLLPAGRPRDAIYAWAVEDLHVPAMRARDMRNLLDALKAVFGTETNRRGVRAWRA